MGTPRYLCYCCLLQFVITQCRLVCFHCTVRPTFTYALLAFLCLFCAGDLTLEEERFLKSQIDDKQEKTRTLQKASEEGLKKLQSMDEAFTKLKQVTGVKNVEEMHEKFSNQKSNKLQLELEVSCG